MDHSSDVGEAPSRAPLLVQDVVGLAQGLLGGGAQVKFPGAPSTRLPCPGKVDGVKVGGGDSW
jgi:hypothetical protein